MKEKFISLKDIPLGFDLKITEELSHFSVAIARVVDAKADTFQPLGSGTLVRKNGKSGILTAHHCLHAKEVSPRIKLGNQNGDIMMCMLKGGRSRIMESFDVIEHELAYFDDDGNYPELEPDLTFLEIVNPQRLSSIEAVSSFWNLDKNIEKIKEEFGREGTVLVNSGFPAADYQTLVQGDSIHHHIKFMSYIGGLSQSDIKNTDKWDYVQATCSYDFSSELPKSFRGISGGGIWSVKIGYKEISKEWFVQDIALVGVNKYQSDISEGRRHITGHYIDSIYETAWK